MTIIKPKFNKHERIILSTLYKERRPMALWELSQLSNMSWQTANKYIGNLEGKGLVKPTGQKRKKVMFDFDIFK